MLKRKADDANVIATGSTSKARKNPEVVAAGTFPLRDVFLSPTVRARLAHCPPNSSELWAYWNRIAISGTNAAKAVGLNQYEDGSPLALWMRLRGHVDDTRPLIPPEQEARMARGNDLEPVARAHYEIAMRTRVTRHDHAFAPDVSWLLHGCDGHCMGRQNVRAVAGAEHPYLIEIKCPMNGPYKNVPIEYMVQMQIGLALHGMQWCDFCVYTHHRAEGDTEGTAPPREHLQVWRVHRSPACLELLLPALAYFVDCLRWNVPPRAAMGIPAAKAELFAPPSVSVSPVFDAFVPPLPKNDTDVMDVAPA